MGLTLDDLKAQTNIVGTDDDAILTRLLSAAQAHVERLIGYPIDDADQFPTGTPADLEHAVLMLAADFYENREASVIGVTNVFEVPFGVRQITDQYRTWSFDDGV